MLISTDWVFDGTQGPAAETEPPNPINPYGFLKASSELVVTQRALEREVTGILHCCGGEHIDRLTLAYCAIDAFDLEPELLDVGPAPADELAAGEVPRDTRLDGTAPARALEAELPDLDTMLGRLRVELEHSGSLV